MKNEVLIKLRGKISRAIVAEKLGITPQGLGMIERGERIPRPDLMKRIAIYYSKTVDELFFNNERHEMCQINTVVQSNDLCAENNYTVNSKLAG